VHCLAGKTVFSIGSLMFGRSVMPMTCYETRHLCNVVILAKARIQAFGDRLLARAKLCASGGRGGLTMIAGLDMAIFSKTEHQKPGYPACAGYDDIALIRSDARDHLHAMKIFRTSMRR
jgi:hypothetical protein